MNTSKMIVWILLWMEEQIRIVREFLNRAISAASPPMRGALCAGTATA